MKLVKNCAHIYGFEDYSMVALDESCLVNKYSWYPPYSLDKSIGNFIINKDLPIKAIKVRNPNWDWIHSVEFEPELCTNHVELLDTAKKVYVHPSCKLSRSMLAEKYKKSLNPYLSDAVVIPKPNFEELSLYDMAIFVNEKEKMVVRINCRDGNDYAKTFKEGDILLYKLSVMPADRAVSYNFSAVCDAEFVYYGPVLFIPNNQSWISDVLTSTLPADKIVFEDSIQESLSNDSNKLDFDSLTSIKDMLESSDDDTVAAGLKSLSMMDWMHYVNSIKFILMSVENIRWKWNNATNSTSVKYMLSTISDRPNRRYWPGGYRDDIYKEDYELFKQLKIHYDKIQPEVIFEYIKTLDFIKATPEGVLVPNYKNAVA